MKPHPDARPAGGFAPLGPGDVLDDRFLVTEAVSCSGQTRVYRAQDAHAGGGDVALKVPAPDREGDPEYLRRFRREEEVGLRLAHPYLVRFLPVSTPRSRPYIVTEYVRGCTLAHLLRAMSPLPEADALHIGASLCEALDYLHGQGLAHCDLKPQNIMVAGDGTIRLIDLGLATPIGWRRAPFGRGAVPMGTPDYMAPEQVRGRRGDARTDLYGLGAMLYEMLTGRVPFEGDTALLVMNARLVGEPEPLRGWMPSLSAETERIVLRALEREPRARHASAAELGAELGRAAGPGPCRIGLFGPMAA